MYLTSLKTKTCPIEAFSPELAMVPMRRLNACSPCYIEIFRCRKNLSPRSLKKRQTEMQKAADAMNLVRA